MKLLTLSLDVHKETKTSVHTASLLHLTFMNIGQFCFKFSDPTISQLHLPVGQSQLVIL